MNQPTRKSCPIAGTESTLRLRHSKSSFAFPATLAFISDGSKLSHSSTLSIVEEAVSIAMMTLKDFEEKSCSGKSRSIIEGGKEQGGSLQ